MIRIERFLPEHASDVASLIVSIQRQEFGIRITLAEQPDLADIPGYYQHGAGNFWIALAGGEVVGELVGWSESKAVRDIFLGTTSKFLGAQRFYEKNGFLEIDRAELPPTFPVMTVDSKFYVRSLRR